MQVSPLFVYFNFKVSLQHGDTTVLCSFQSLRLVFDIQQLKNAKSSFFFFNISKNVIKAQ